MKNTNNGSKSSVPGFLERSQVSELVVRPLADLIDRQRLDCIEEGRKILAKLQELDDLIGIIARHLNNQEVEEGDR